jgi:hypothetical protein
VIWLLPLVVVGVVLLVFFAYRAGLDLGYSRGYKTARRIFEPQPETWHPAGGTLS